MRVRYLRGQAAGLLYRCGPLRLGRLRLPAGLCWLADTTLGRLLSSSPPTDGPMAATLEAQRQQQIDMLEQQMLLDRYREMRQRNTVSAGRTHGRTGAWRTGHRRVWLPGNS